jgi:hypothetical protein
VSIASLVLLLLPAPPALNTLQPLMQETVAALHDMIDAREPLETRRKRNASRTICRLPVEIIAHIFLYAQYERARRRPSHVRFTPAWTRLMLVCHAFRIVAVQTPALWNVLESRVSEQWKELCLERSQNVPLVLSAGHDRYIHRAQSAVLKSPPPEVLNVWTDDPEGPDHLKFAVTSRMFGGTIHSLLHLTLQGRQTSIVSSVPYLPSLRHLTLQSVTTTRDLTPVFDLLVNAPVLEELFISNFFFSTTSENQARVHPQIPLVLPYLKALHVALDIVSMQTLLGALPKPCTALSVRTYYLPGQLPSLGASANHDQIYAWCAEFVRNMHGALRSQGTIFINRYRHDPTSQPLAFVSYGKSWEEEDISHRTDPHFFCQLVFVPDRAHPLLAVVETLRLGSGCPRTNVVYGLLKHSPHLRTVLLNAGRSVSVHYPWLKGWIVRRAGKIEHIVLKVHYVIGKDHAAFMDELRSAGMTPTVTREDS